MQFDRGAPQEEGKNRSKKGLPQRDPSQSCEAAPSGFSASKTYRKPFPAVVRKTARVNKVTSSHTKGETVIISEQPVDVEALKAAIAETGYTVTGVQTRPYEKKGFFSFLKK